jgi:DnaJ family protein A protein 5
VFECVVCDKTFKSEGQVQAHERSKKHQAELRNLRWEMRLEDDALALGGEGGEPDEAETADGEDGLAEAVGQVSLAGDDGSASGDAPDVGSDDDASSTSPDAVEATAGLGTDTATTNTAASPQPKAGKAALKRARKAAAATSQQSNNEGAFKCAQCNAAFPSRTRLFQHIGDFGHAALKPAAAGKGRKKGKR